MLLMGDEVRRTQRGNNNAYCQDNEISWFDWSLRDQHADVHRFVEHLLRLRLTFDQTHKDRRLTLDEFLTRARVEWHGVKLGQPDWGDSSHSLAFTLYGLNGRTVTHFILNAFWEPLTFELPPSLGGGWRRLIDTHLPSPQDIADRENAPQVPDSAYSVQPRSLVVLFSDSLSSPRAGG